MRSWIVLCALALTAARGQAEPFTYKFAPRSPLKYRTILISEGSFSLPDGAPKSMKLEAVATVVLTPKGATPEGFEIASETLRTKTMMDGADVPAPAKLETKRTFKVRPNGVIVGGEEQTFAVVFPEKTLARGETFTEERKTPAGGPSLPLKTTYTVADTAAKVDGYPHPVTLLEASSELAAAPAGRKVTLKEAGGKLWFDPAAGVLVKTALVYSFTEETPMPDGSSVAARRTMVRYASELIK